MNRELLGEDRSHLFYLITMLHDAALNIFIFTVSRELAETGAGLFLMGLFGMGFSVAFAVSSFVFGGVSDRKGKKLFMYLGVLVVLASSILCYLLPPGTPFYLAAYTGAGLSGGLLYPPIISWLNRRHSLSSHSRGISSTVVRFSISWNLGVLLGNYSAGKIFELSSTAPFLLAAGACVVNLLILRVLIPSKPGNRRRTAPVHHEKPSTVSADPEKARLFVTLSWTANIGGAFIGSMMIHLFPQLAVEMGIAPELHGTLLSITRAAVMATYLIMHTTAFWQYRFPVLLSLQGLTIGGLLVMFFAQGAGAVLIALICVAFLGGHNYFAGLFYGNANAGQENRGASSGLHQGTIATGVALGSLGGGIIGVFYGARAPYLLAIAVIFFLAALQISLVLRFKTRRAKKGVG